MTALLFLWVFFPLWNYWVESITHFCWECSATQCCLKTLPVKSMASKIFIFLQYFSPRKAMDTLEMSVFWVWVFLYARVILNSLKFYQAEISVSAAIFSHCFLWKELQRFKIYHFNTMGAVCKQFKCSTSTNISAACFILSLCRQIWYVKVFTKFQNNNGNVSMITTAVWDIASTE